jgi:hypothetical protein
MGNPEISTHCESPGIGRDSACPPEPLLCFAMACLLWNYRPREDAIAAEAVALRAIALKER